MLMKGQVAVEAFFAALMAFLAVSWLLNYSNQVHESSYGVMARQEQLIAAQVAAIANEVCTTNLSVSFKAPCVVLANQTVLYTINSPEAPYNRLSVFSPNVPGAYNASAICPVTVNLSVWDDLESEWKWAYLACNIQDEIFTQRLCMRREAAGGAGLRLGGCFQ